MVESAGHVDDHRANPGLRVAAARCTRGEAGAKTKIGELAKTSKEVESKVQEWLAVLARCFQLQDAMGVLELDRVLDTTPEELDRHRLALRAARRNRLELISRSTEHLLARMNAAAGTVNTKGADCIRPSRSGAFEQPGYLRRRRIPRALGIERGRESLEARRWIEAATEAWDKARETGADGLGTVRRYGSETRDRVKSAKDLVSTGSPSERAARQWTTRNGTRRIERSPTQRAKQAL